jgi:hypothetical protein
VSVVALVGKTITPGMVKSSPPQEVNSTLHQTRNAASATIAVILS